MSTFSPHFSYFLLNARFFANCPRLHEELISGFFPDADDVKNKQNVKKKSLCL